MSSTGWQKLILESLVVCMLYSLSCSFLLYFLAFVFCTFLHTLIYVLVAVLVNIVFLFYFFSWSFPFARNPIYLAPSLLGISCTALFAPVLSPYSLPFLSYICSFFSLP